MHLITDVMHHDCNSLSDVLELLVFDRNFFNVIKFSERSPLAGSEKYLKAKKSKLPLKAAEKNGSKQSNALAEAHFERVQDK
jgi:hypothetical protein